MKRASVMMLGLCVACVSAPPAPRMLAPDLQIGALAERTRFEQSDFDRSEPETDHGARPERRQRTRTALFWTGIGMVSFGAVGFAGFGIGGRVVQRKIERGFEDGSLTHDDKDRLDRTGVAMNGLAIGSGVVGLLGIGLAALVYGIDNAKCGELKPRRSACRQSDPTVTP
jgi:hypothetical protein